MSNIEDKVWDHLVEHHGADRTRMATATATAPRTRRWPVAVGLAATGLATAAVVTVLVAGSGSSPELAGGSHPATVVLRGAANGRDTAYVLKRVNARIAEDPSGAVYRTYGDPSGGETTDGSLVHVGRETFSTYSYDAPDGVHYVRTVFSSDGVTSFFTDYPAVNGKATTIDNEIDSVTHTYATQRWTNPVPPGYTTGGAPTDVAAVRHALRSGRLTRIGTTTLDGTPVIALAATKAQGYAVTLYVDAQTYQPLRQVDSNPDHDPRYFKGLYVTDWLPATPGNVATAEGGSIPAGYTKVANVH